MQIFCNGSNKLTKQKCIAFFQDKILSFNISKSQEKMKFRSFFLLSFTWKVFFIDMQLFLQYDILKKSSFSIKDEWYETVYIFAAILTWKVTLHKLSEKSFHTSIFLLLTYSREYRVFWNPVFDFWSYSTQYNSIALYNT